MAQKLWKLFISMLYLSTFTFGGGYVIVTLMQKKFVDEYHWIDKDEMLDLVAIAQSAPGAIAVNGSIVVGYKIAGILGIIVSVIATIIPPFVIISIISVFYQIFKENLLIKYLLDGMQSGVGAVISVVVFEMAAGIFKQKNFGLDVAMLINFIAVFICGILIEPGINRINAIYISVIYYIALGIITE